jgi:hypothetical protein
MQPNSKVAVQQRAGNFGNIPITKRLVSFVVREKEQNKSDEKKRK